MKNLTNRLIRPLTDDELLQVAGGGGHLGVSFTAPPLHGGVDLAYKGRAGTLTGSLTTDGTTWKGGIGGQVRIGRANLEGTFRSDLKAWEVQATLRIPLGKR